MLLAQSDDRSVHIHEADNVGSGHLFGVLGVLGLFCIRDVCRIARRFDIRHLVLRLETQGLILLNDIFAARRFL